ncbi:MAG: FAD-dependent oxidoreductase [Calditrichaeota bacterium]|nr:FAD-dependent oxidoreductase [Calditrichota bacterium]
MCPLVLKPKKPLVTTGAHAAGGAVGGETSNLRPYQIEKLAPCMDACPQGTEIRRVLTTIAQAEKYEKPQDEAFDEAWRIIAEKNPLPAVCGRVCPHPCEEKCNRDKKDGSVGINNIERFLGDWGLQRGLKPTFKTEEHYPEKIAVIGSGPAGLSCAYYLARNGYKVTIYEAFPHPGGMLRYGIPAYRLPRDILDAEIERVLDLGVELKTGVVVGKDIPYTGLQAQYDAIFVGIGAHQGVKLRVPGEDVSNVYSGVTFLRLVNMDKPVETGDKVVVIGGGDTAIDAARVALRLGAKVTLLYRRTRNEMPAIEEEIVGAEEEGVVFHFLAAPLEIITEDGKAVAMRCQRMELGEPDASGRRRPVPIPGDEFTIPVTAVIAAVSQEPGWDGLDHLHTGRDWVKADKLGETSIEKTFAGGDVLDLGLVTIALYQGRRAAETIHRRFRGCELSEESKLPVIPADKITLTYYENVLRQECEKLAVEDRFKEPWVEIAKTLPEAAVIAEAKRCMSCGSCFDCGSCWSYCQDNAIIKPLQDGMPYKFKLEFCKGCNKCAENCPCGYLEMK